MEAGKLNKRITFRAKSATPDTWGQLTNAWTDVFTVWGSVADLSGREFLAAQAQQSEVTTRIIIRKRAGITADMHAACNGTVYNIISSPIDDGQGRQLQIMCKRV